MCFVKTSSAPVAVEPQEPVIRHEANASTTKNSKDDRNIGAFVQNIKTSFNGLEDNPNVKRKTLLGE